MEVKINGFPGGILPEELTRSLISVASNWGDTIDFSSLKADYLNGMSNDVFRISWPAAAKGEDAAATGPISRIVIVRMYRDVGWNLFFKRDEEIHTFENLSRLGYGPKLLAKFPRGRVEEFIHGKTLSDDDVHDPEISALIAVNLREFHNVDMPGAKNVRLWENLRNWLGVAKKCCSLEDAKEYMLDTLETEIDALEKMVSGSHQEIGFCHNDLHCRNMIFDDKNLSITLIDYECACYNPIAFDIANYFCEMAGNHDPDSPYAMDCTKYPDVEERHHFIRHYLKSPGEEVDGAAVKKLAEDVEKYTLASHLLMGILTIIWGSASRMEFDYAGYVRERFDQYWLTKRELLK